MEINGPQFEHLINVNLFDAFFSMIYCIDIPSSSFALSLTQNKDVSMFGNVIKIPLK